MSWGGTMSMSDLFRIYFECPTRLLVITYKTRSTSKPAYLSDLLQDYRPARTLRSSDKLLLSVSRMALAFSAKVFSVSAPSVWNSLSYQCRSAELFGSFRGILTSSSAVANRPRDASCLSVVSFNGTKRRVESFIVSYVGYRFVTACS